MILIKRFFIVVLISIFITNIQNYIIVYNNVLCFKPPVNLLSKGFLNGKPFYYFGDIKLIELGYRIQFLLDNFDKIDLKTVKYLQKGLIINRFDPYNSYYHPHFLIELKSNIDNFNNFYINFQLSTKQHLEFEKLTNTNLNTNNKIQCISPHLRVYATNVVEILENRYSHSEEFIESNKNVINNYILTNLKEYTPNFEIIKK